MVASEPLTEGIGLVDYKVAITVMRRSHWKIPGALWWKEQLKYLQVANVFPHPVNSSYIHECIIMPGWCTWLLGAVAVAEILDSHRQIARPLLILPCSCA